MRRCVLRAIWLIWLTTATAFAAGAPGDEAAASFEAVYAVGIPDAVVAEMKTSVKHNGDIILYHSTTQPRGLAGRLLNDAVLTTDTMLRDSGGRLLPLEYRYRIKGRPHKNRSYDFDWNAQRATVGKGGETGSLAIARDVVDENTLQLQLMRDLAAAAGAPFDRDYRVLSGGKLKMRRFVKTGEETIETVFGQVATTRVERFKRGRVDHIYWFSPQHGYVPLRIEKLDDGDVERRLTIRELHRGR